MYENLPWEYPIKSLKTLCKKCHEAIHKITKVPVYFDSSLEAIFGFKLNCTRCNGIGYLEEYNHVKNGVCFECGGSGGIFIQEKQPGYLR